MRKKSRLPLRKRDDSVRRPYLEYFNSIYLLTSLGFKVLLALLLAPYILHWQKSPALGA